MAIIATTNAITNAEGWEGRRDYMLHVGWICTVRCVGGVRFVGFIGFVGFKACVEGNVEGSVEISFVMVGCGNGFGISREGEGEKGWGEEMGEKGAGRI